MYKTINCKYFNLLMIMQYELCTIKKLSITNTFVLLVFI